MDRSFNGDEVSRIRFQASLLEAVGLAVVATDMRGKIVYWNKAAERMYGWPSEEAVGRTAGEVLVSGEFRERAEEIMDALGRGNSWSGEFTVMHRNGDPLSVLVSDTPVYGGEGEMIGIVGVSTDITRRKQMEEELRESETRFRTQYQEFPIPTYSWRSIRGDFVLIDYNDAAHQTTRGRIANLLGRKASDMYSDKPEVLDWFSRCSRKKTTITEERWWTLESTGEIRYLLITFVFVPPDLVMVHAEDFTEHKRAEEALRESERQLHLFSLATNDVFWEVDLVTGQAKRGIGFERTFGYAPEEIGQDHEWWSDRLHPDDRERVLSIVQEAIARGDETYSYEYRFRCRDGSYAVVEERAYIVSDETGTSVRMLGAGTDITGRKRAEETLRESEERYGIIARATNDVIWEVDLAAEELRWIGDVQRVFGYSTDEVKAGEWWEERVHPEDRERPVLGIERMIQGGEDSWSDEYRFRFADGSYGTVVDRAFAIRDENGDPVRLIGSMLDVTRRREAEETLKESEERFRTLTDAALEALIISERVSDETGRILGVNRAFTEMFGYEPEEAAGKSAQDMIAPETLDLVEKNISSGYTGVYEAVGLRKDGTRLDLEIRGKIVTYRGRRVRISALRDVSERKRMEDALRKSEEEYRELFENHPQPMWVYDTGTLEFLAVNEAAVRHYGYSRDEFLSMTIAAIRPAEEIDRLHEVARVVSEGPRYASEWRHRKKDGTVFDVEISSHGTPFDGRAARLVQAVDVTERKLLEEQLAHQAFHDSLTGLPNRALFADRLEHALAGVRRSDSVVAVLFADLDNFKSINDSLGHEMGDQLLVAVAERLRACLRPEDTLARFGGDEFAILLEAVENPADVARVANRVTEEFREPFGLGGREVFVSVSIGISLEDSEDALPEITLRNADTAMYQAKERDGVSYEIFEPGMYARVLDRLELENDLRRALDQGEFRVHYQPLVGLQSGKIVGVEALVRWENPERGLVNPAEFIPLAEETGLIVPLGRWVLEEACRQARAWHSEHPEAAHLEIGVNLSLRQFQNPDLVEEVADALRETGLAPRYLWLEITESVAMKDAEFTVSVLQGLKRLGVRLAIDDFGKGHSSLTYLIKRFQMDVLKIDRSFVAELGRDTDYETIVAGITGIARSLNLRVVAEGIETAEQYAQARSMGCDTAQGFYFSRPVPSEEASALLAAGTRW